jgi:hypothetical protein
MRRFGQDARCAADSAGTFPAEPAALEYLPVFREARQRTLQNRKSEKIVDIFRCFLYLTVSINTIHHHINIGNNNENRSLQALS